MTDNKGKHESAGFGKYILIWCALVGLTGLTVAAAGLDFGYPSIVIVLIVAALKSSLVLDYFMHLRYEERFFKLMLLVVIVTLAIILSLTFVDIAYR